MNVNLAVLTSHASEILSLTALAPHTEVSAYKPGKLWSEL